MVDGYRSVAQATTLSRVAPLAMIVLWEPVVEVVAMLPQDEELPLAHPLLPTHHAPDPKKALRDLWSHCEQEGLLPEGETPQWLVRQEPPQCGPD